MRAVMRAIPPFAGRVAVPRPACGEPLASRPTQQCASATLIAAQCALPERELGGR